MKLIVGLGNPDREYRNTFHNLGFSSLDILSDILGITVNKLSCKALIGTGIVNGEKIFLAKPQTYMNLSGESVAEIMSYYKIPKKDLIVIYDDFDLPKGAVRIRESGSAGTHNGMRNIVKMLGTEEFARIRIGFNPDIKELDLLNYVLSGIPSADKPIFTEAMTTAAKAAQAFAEGKDFEFIMRTFNRNVKPNA